MPIKNILIYEPSLKGIEKEEDVIELLKEVKKNIDEIYPTTKPFQKKPLKEVLEIVEKGSYTPPFARYSILDEIDLLRAKNLISEYRRLSEKGCQSCKNLAKACYFNEIFFFCELHEKEQYDNPGKINIDSNYSPRVLQYEETGCNERQAVFRKLEEILAGLV